MIPYEMENFLRIVYLYHKVVNPVLRRFFDGIHQNLSAELPASRKEFKQLYNKGKLIFHEYQLDKLYPSKGSQVSSADLDLTLMVCLLRNFPRVVPKPKTGFDCLPDKSDDTEGAHLARMKYYKNELLSHSTSGKLDIKDFNVIWEELEKAILGLGNAQDVAEATHAKTEQLESSMKTFLSTQIQLENKVITLQNQMEKEQDARIEIQTKLKSIEEKLITAEKTTNQQIKEDKIDTSNLQEMQEKRREEITAINKSIEELEKNLTELKEFQVNLLNLIDKLDNLVNESQTKIEDVKRQIESTCSEIQKNLSEHEERITALELQHVEQEWMTGILKEWNEEDKYFVDTTASKYVTDCLHKHVCVSVVGPSGIGKTFLVQHVALEMKKEKDGYTIIKVYSPEDIKKNCIPSRKTLFVVDDLCGNCAANTSRLDVWKNSLKDISKFLESNSFRLMITCRLQVFQDEGFQHSDFDLFKTCICNLVETNLELSDSEKESMLLKYLGNTDTNKLKSLYQYEFFPLLCKLLYKKKDQSNFCLETFLEDPFASFEKELNNLFVDSNEGKYKFIALLLLVLYNNHFDTHILTGKDNTVKQILENILDECRINVCVRFKSLIQELDTLTGTFVVNRKGVFHTMHDKLFDFLAYYFGAKNEVTKTDFTELLIRHADEKIINERCVIKEPGQSAVTKSKEYVIIIEDDNLQSYTERVFDDMTKVDYGMRWLYSNRNRHNEKLQYTLCTVIKNLDKAQISNLIQTSSCEFVQDMFVMDVNDNEPHSLIPFRIILDHDYFQEYIARIFDDITKSDNIFLYLFQCRSSKNEAFRTGLLDHFFKLSSITILNLIETSSTDFVRRMFVTDVKDIKSDSPHQTEHYGIVLGHDQLQKYIARIFDDITKSDESLGRFITCRCIFNDAFYNGFLHHISKLSSTKISNLLETASIEFVREMFVTDVKDIKLDSRWPYECYGIILEHIHLQKYIERMFDDMTTSHDVNIKQCRCSSKKVFRAGLLNHISKLSSTKISNLIETASNDFVCKMFVMDVKDIQSNSQCHNKHYGIVLNHDHIQKYIERMFDDMTKSNNVICYMDQCRCCSNEAFRIDLLHYISKLSSTKITNLIETASIEFVRNMFVTDVKDIKSDSRYPYQRYGIVLDNDHLQKYSKIIFDHMTKTNMFYTERCRCCSTEAFRTGLLNHISKLSSTKISNLIETASIEFVSKMFVTDVKDIKSDSYDPYERLGIVLDQDHLQTYVKRIFGHMTKYHDVRSFIEENRCCRNEACCTAFLNHMIKLKPTEIADLIQIASSSYRQLLFVMEEQDIKLRSFHVYKRYGIVIPADAIQVYIGRVFGEMTGSDDVDRHITCNRNSRNAKFQTKLLHFMKQLDKTAIKHLIKEATGSFLNQLCVMDDTKEVGERECERYSIIIPDECIVLYVDRWFNEITKSDNILLYFEENRNRQSQKFKTALLTYITELQEENIKELINTAGPDFLHKLFVTTKKDIKHDSIRDFEHYGIVLQHKYMDMYTMRLLDLHDFTKKIKYSRAFTSALKCMGQFDKSRVTDLIRTAKENVFHQMITVDMENKLQFDKKNSKCKSPDSNVQNILEMKEGPIMCPISCISLYMDRMISDWRQEKLVAIFTNKNLKNQFFVDKFLDYLNLLGPSKTLELVNIKTETYKETCLEISCKHGEVNLAKWCFERYLRTNQEQEHNSLFALFLLVVYNNQLEETILSDEFIGTTNVKLSFRQKLNIREDILAENVKQELDTTLKIIGVDKKEGVYSLRYGKVFSFFVFYFGSIRQMSKDLVEYADEKLLCKWFLVEESFSEVQHFIIRIPVEELLTCINRVFTKMTHSGEFIRYILEGQNKTNVNSFSDYVRKLNKKEKITILENSCIDFINKFFVIAPKETKDHSHEESIFSIVLLDNSTPVYIKRIFNYISNTDCVEACFQDNRNRKNEIFHTRLSIYMKDLKIDDVNRLIDQSSSDFVNRMFVISEEDIKPESCWEYERYGIVLPKDLLPKYMDKVFSEMTKSVHEPVNRNSGNKTFRKTFSYYISSIIQNNPLLLLEKASSKLIHRMFFSTEGDLVDLNTQRYENYHMFIPKNYFRLVPKTYSIGRKGSNTFFLKGRFTRTIIGNDSGTFTISATGDKDCEDALITVRSKLSIDNFKLILSEYIDPMFTYKIMEMCVGFTEWLVGKYILRMVDEWKRGNLHDVFGNINLNTQSFRSTFLTYLHKIEKLTQTELTEATDNKTGDSALAVSCRVGIIELVKWCLANNASTNSCNKYGEHPLYIACNQNRPDIVYRLLHAKEKADVNQKTSNFRLFPLYEACKNGNSTIVSMLVKENVNVNGHSDYFPHERPLHVACKYGHNKIVSILLSSKAYHIDVNEGDDTKKTPLYIACKRGNTELVNLLLNHNADDVDIFKDTIKQETPLYAACKGGYTDIVILLLTRETKVINKSRFDEASPLWVTCRMGHVGVVSTLLHYNDLQIDKCILVGMTPLFIGSLLGHTEIVKMLLDKEADSSICVKNKEIVMTVFEKYRPIFYRKETFDYEKYFQYIRKLVMENASEHVKSYIDGKEKDWVFKSILGASPLHIGSLMGHTEIVESLVLENDLNINCFSENGNTPLLLACELGHEDIVHVLLSNGAVPTLDRKDGKSPLTIARDNGHTKIVEIINSQKSLKSWLRNSCSVI